MIVRILGEGQLRIDDAAVPELNELDTRLEATVERGDEDAFHAALDTLLARVRELGLAGRGRGPGAVRAHPPGRGRHDGRGPQAAGRRRAHPRLTRAAADRARLTAPG